MVVVYIPVKFKRIILLTGLKEVLEMLVEERVPWCLIQMIPSGKKLWAGSVSGGLWVVQNYDSVNYSYEVFESPWSVKVGPNPVIGDSLNVYVTSDIQRSVDFEIFNVVGEKVANVTANLAAGSHTVVFDTSVFAGSTYFMVVTSGDKKEVFRLLVM